MDLKHIQNLIRQFEKSNLTTLEIESEGFKLKCSKGALSETHVDIKGEHVSIAQPKPQGYEVKSPLVGTFYAANTPKGKPLVSVGDFVEINQPLCIIEAMKTMNEITAPVSGTIKAIYAKNEDPVGYEQVLMVIA